jgi:hypothetical protein
MRRVFTFVSAVAMSAGLAQFAAAQNPPTPPATEQPSTPPTSDTSAQSPSSARADHSQKMSGELLSVDPTTKMLTIKSSDGREAKFSYNDQTAISGVKEQAAGLATAAGSKVTVEYTGSGDAMVATKIKVQGAKKSSTKGGDTSGTSGTSGTTPQTPQNPQ